MAKKLRFTSNPITDRDSGMAVEAVGDAVALGTATLSSVDAASTMVDHGKKVVAKGVVTATAAAETADGDLAYADAFTDVAVAGGDRVRTVTNEISYSKEGIAYETAVTQYKAVDFVNRDHKVQIIVHKDIDFVDGNVIITNTKDISIEINGFSHHVSKTNVIERDHPKHDLDLDIDLDGNVALLNVDASAIAENTLVDVDAYALTLEDELSQSTLLIITAVD